MKLEGVILRYSYCSRPEQQERAEAAQRMDPMQRPVPSAPVCLFTDRISRVSLDINGTCLGRAEKKVKS